MPDAKTKAHGPIGVVSRDELRGLSGLDFLRRMAGGELPRPPISALLDFLPVLVEPGRVVFEGTPRFDHYNPIGVVHGGYAATLLDSAMGCAVHSRLEAGQAYTTLEFKVNFVRALTDQTGPVRAEGTLLHLGRTIATAEGRLVDGTGRLLAHGTTTCAILASRAAGG